MAEFIKITIIKGSGIGNTYRFHYDNLPIQIGRSKDCSIHLPDEDISRNHAEIYWEAGQFWIRDLGSRNGTLLDDRKIEKKRLLDEDQIQIGSRELLIEIQSDETDSTPSNVVIDENNGDRTILISAVQEKPLQEVSGSSASQTQEIIQRFIALLDLGHVILETPKPEVLWEHVFQAIFDNLRVDRGFIIKRNHEKEGYEFLASKFRSENQQGACRVSRQVIDRVLNQGETFFCSDIRKHPAFSESHTLVEQSVRSFLCAPLKAGKNIFGALYVDNISSPTSLREEDASFLNALAIQAAHAIQNLNSHQQLIDENQELKRILGLQHDLLGVSRPMKEVYRLIAKAAAANSTVMIRGESGTGKELVARAIHRNSGRKDNPFVAVNCAVLSEELLASELFGHEKGAFTGAHAARKGKFELADQGTILLDEIAEMRPSTQTKLLRVLQEQEFERVGGNRTIRVDVRVISATSVNLEERIRLGSFREDLYYRLNVFKIALPALREKREDIPALVEHFLDKAFAKQNWQRRPIPGECMARLIECDWRGNVRQLENVIEQAVVLCGEDGNLDLACFPDFEMSPATENRDGEGILSLDQAEKRHIMKILSLCNGKKIQAAKLLNVARTTLDRKLTEHGIDIDQYK